MFKLFIIQITNHRGINSLREFYWINIRILSIPICNQLKMLSIFNLQLWSFLIDLHFGVVVCWEVLVLDERTVWLDELVVWVWVVLLVDHDVWASGQKPEWVKWCKGNTQAQWKHQWNQWVVVLQLLHNRKLSDRHCPIF